MSMMIPFRLEDALGLLGEYLAFAGAEPARSGSVSSVEPDSFISSSTQ